MYDERATELGNYYTRITDKSVETIYSISREITNSITEIVKLIFEKLRENKEQQEKLDRVRVDIGSDVYVLSRDPDMPDAWKWKKLDSIAGQYRAEAPTEFQLQTISQRLAADVADGVSQTDDCQPCLQIVGTTESGKEVVFYAQDETGNCKTNLATQLLTPEELAALTDCTSNIQQQQAAAGAALSLEAQLEGTSSQSKLSSAEQLDSKDLPSLKQELESNLMLAVKLMATRNQKAEELTQLSKTLAANESSDRLGEVMKDLVSIDERIADVFLQSAATIKNYQQQLNELSSNLVGEDRNSDRVRPIEASQDSATVKNTASSQPRQVSQEQNQNSVVPKSAVEYTYKQVLDSPTIQPGTKQWVRQLDIPIYKIISQKLERQRLASENKKIAKTATALLKRYGQIQTDGSLLYRSDAFAIIKQGTRFTIHRRHDELQGFKQPLMEFKLERNGTPKITQQPKEMLPAERQEFVMVAERLADPKTLLSLSTSDLRDMANTLGSLAPAGTLSTLESFKQIELLGTLNGILQKAKTDKLTVGELTIVRRRDPEHNKASLSLYKTTSDGNPHDLVEFQLEKKSDEISQEITKMNISEQDINYIKLIAQKAQLFDLERLVNSANSSSTPTYQPQQKLNESQEIKGIGDFAIPLHPLLAEEWKNLQPKGQLWSDAMMQGNDEINEKIRANNGKLSVAEQREMYFKIVAAKVAQSDSKGDKGIDLIPLKQIMKDLEQQRQQVIIQTYTPKTKIFVPEKVAAKVASTLKKNELEL